MYSYNSQLLYGSFEDNPNLLMYFLNHVLNYFMDLVNYCCNIDVI
jgi:hypothetical protein